MGRNIDRLAARAAGLGVGLRPHLKTAKSIDVARRMLAGGNGVATVSTLREAEVFAAAGVRDIVYAVGISPQKLERVVALRRSGCDLAVLLDSMEQAEAVAAASRAAGERIPALIEIDSDDHRAGLRPDDPGVVAVGRALHEGGAEVRGVLTHAGGSYDSVGVDAHAAWAERERAAVVGASEALRASGLPCPVVSVGSTPTAHAARDLTGVTEVRAGVHVFFDLVMAGLGVCGIDDIALSVLTTVIGHQRSKGWTLIDAGWMALSRDRGTASQEVDQGYGVVCDESGRIMPDLIVRQTSQEHGVIARRDGAEGTAPEAPVGTRLRILPNHACATAAQHASYHVLPADPDARLVEWARFGGW
jgi:D-serine deaminase-like pyridoxal phosphate-dependent protein